MFREQYKAAYDEIKGDRTKIDKIFAMAEEKPAKKAVFPFRAATAVAAALVLAVSIYAYPELMDTTKPKDKELKTVDLSDYAYPKVENAEITAADSGKEKTADKETIGSAEPQTTKKTDSTHKNAGAFTNDTAKNNTVSDMAPKQESAVPANETAPELYAASGQGALADVTSESDVSVQTADEFVETDRAARAGGAAYTDSNVNFFAAELSDSVLYSEAKEVGNGMFFVTVYAESSEAESALKNSETEQIAGCAVAIEKADNQFTAYAEKENNYYKFESYDLTETEFKSEIEKELK